MKSSIREVFEVRRAALAAMFASFGMRAEVTDDDDPIVAQSRARQEELLALSDTILDAADAENRELSPEEQASLRQQQEEHERLDAQIQLRERQRAQRSSTAAMSQSRGRRTDPNTAQATPQSRVAIDGRGPVERAARMIDLAAPVVRPSYARMFGQPPRAPQQEGGFRQFLNAVAMRDSQFLLSRPQAGASTLTGTDGGFAVPAYVSAALFDSVVEQSQFLRFCRVVPMEGQQVTYPVLNFSDRSKGPGALVAQKVAEGGAATIQTPKMREVLLKAKKAILLWTTTTELLQDAVPGTDQALIAAAAGAIAMQLDREIASGTGINELLGIANAAARVVVTKDGSQSANTVSFTNLTGCISRLLGSSWRNAMWVVSQTALPQLFALYNPVMNSTNVVGGIPAPLTQGADGTYRLFGLPLVVSDFMPVLSSEGDIQLIDLSRFVIGMREDLRMEISRDVMFTTDEVAYRVVQRRDGCPIDDKAITPAVGSTTLSPFVVLGAR